MPIKPENRSRYPANWAEISERIRFERAQGRCECRGECGHEHVHVAEDWIGTWTNNRCKAIYDLPHPVTGSRVVLTVAHLDHTPENSADGNLRAMCQRCHLAYDQEEHQRSREETRKINMAGRTRRTTVTEAPDQTVADVMDQTASEVEAGNLDLFVAESAPDAEGEGVDEDELFRDLDAGAEDEADDNADDDEALMTPAETPVAETAAAAPRRKRSKALTEQERVGARLDAAQKRVAKAQGKVSALTETYEARLAKEGERLRAAQRDVRMYKAAGTAFAEAESEPNVADWLDRAVETATEEPSDG